MEIEQFTRSVVPERDKLFRYAFRLLRNKEDAEDTVQETLLRMWHMNSKLEEYQNLGTLAMIINKNLCLDKLKKAGRFSEEYDDHLPEQHDNPQTALEKKDACQMVARCMEFLPDLQKLTLRMRDVEGYELEEIARITGSSAEAVRMNLSRARKRIRDMYFSIENYEREH